MPRKSDTNTTDDEAKEGSRVTRSLRKRLNSVDQEETTPPKSKSADPKLGSISEHRSPGGDSRHPDDAISVDDSCSMSSSQQPPGSVRRTRARLNSSLTVENVNALTTTTTDSPARRSTRRSSGAIEPTTTTTTPARRTTRRTSQTSDDGSVASSQVQTAGRSTRRSVARPTAVETLDEEDEPPAEPPSVTKIATATPRRLNATTAAAVGTPNRRFKTSPSLSTVAEGKSDVVVVIESDEEAEHSNNGPHPVGIHRSPTVNPADLDATQVCTVMLTQFKPNTPVLVIESSLVATVNRSASPNMFSTEEIKQSPESNTSAASPVANAVNSPLRKVASPAVAVRSSPRLSVGTASPVQSVAEPPQTPKRSPRVSLSLSGSQPSASKSVNNADDVPDAVAVTETAAASATLNDSMEPMEVDVSNDEEGVMHSANTSATTAAEEPATIADEQVQGRKSLGGSVRRSSLATPDNNPVNSNKSVTFAELPAVATAGTPTTTPSKPQLNASADDEFHDTCSDLPDPDASGENVSDSPAATNVETAAVRSPFVLDAGVTPLRKRPNLSLRSSTPIVTSTAPPASPPSVVAQKPAVVAAVAPPPQLLADKRKTIGSTRETAATASPELRRPPLSRSWSQAVHGNAGVAIDRGTNQSDIVDEEIVIKVPVRKPQLDDYDDDDEEDSDADAADKSAQSNSFVDGEAEEAPEGAESGDSMDSSERREIEEHEIPEGGVSIGSEDSDEEDAAGGEEEVDDEMDSFIVSDGEVDEDDLLDGTGDDLADVSHERSKKSNKKKKSINRIQDSSSSSSAASGEDELAHDESLCVEEEDDEAGQPEADVGGGAQSSGMDSSTSAKDESTAEDENVKNTSSVAVTDRQTSKLLSKSLHQVAEKKQRNKQHNKSVNAAANASGGEKVLFTSLLMQQKQQKKSATPVVATDAVEAEEPKLTTRKSLNKSLAAAQESTEEPEDVEMNEVPEPKQPQKVKAKAPIQFKAPQYENILDRCGQILAKANEARRLDKLQNKKEISDDQVDLLKQKKEARQVEKARRAAALIEQQKQEAERRKRKAEKKAARKLAMEQEALNPKPVVVAAVVESTEKVTGHKSKKHIPATVKAQSIVNQITETDTTTIKKPKKVAEYFPLPDVADLLVAGKKKAKITAKEVVDVVDEPVKLTKKAKKQLQAVVVEEPIVVEQSKKKTKKPQQPAVVDRSSTSDDSPKPQQQPHSEQPSKKQKKLLKIVKMNSEPQSIETVTANAATNKSQAASAAGKKKRTVNDAAFEAAEQPAPVSKKFKTTKADASKVKKRLNILNSSSSSAGDAAAAAPIVRDNYKILQIRSQPTAVNNSSNDNKAKKRKVAYHEKPTAPEKPQWTSAGAFVVSKVAGKAHGNENYTIQLEAGARAAATSDFVVTSLSKKRKIQHAAGNSTSDPAAAAATALAEFRERAQFDKRVKRETAKQLLQRKDKQRANARV